MPVQRYVFSCVVNQAKDLVKRKWRPEVSMDDATIAELEGAVPADQGYADVERELPELPLGLTELEQEIIVRLYLDATQREVASTLGISRTQMERAMRSIREKLAVLPERALAA